MPVKAVQSAWCYLFGAIQRSIWMETGELFKSPCQKEQGTQLQHWLLFFLFFFSDVYQILHQFSDTSDEFDFHKAATLSTLSLPSVLSAPQGLHCEHSRSDSCFQACVCAGYVVSND